MATKKKKKVAKKSHKRLTIKCKTCGQLHKKTTHKSHGKGSFKRTH